jgi:hypothetical protein
VQKRRARRQLLDRHVELMLGLYTRQWTTKRLIVGMYDDVFVELGQFCLRHSFNLTSQQLLSWMETPRIYLYPITLLLFCSND